MKYTYRQLSLIIPSITFLNFATIFGSSQLPGDDSASNDTTSLTHANTCTDEDTADMITALLDIANDEDSDAQTRINALIDTVETILDAGGFSSEFIEALSLLEELTSAPDSEIAPDVSTLREAFDTPATQTRVFDYIIEALSDSNIPLLERSSAASFLISTLSSAESITMREHLTTIGETLASEVENAISAAHATTDTEDAEQEELSIPETLATILLIEDDTTRQNTMALIDTIIRDQHLNIGTRLTVISVLHDAGETSQATQHRNYLSNDPNLSEEERRRVDAQREEFERRLNNS